MIDQKIISSQCQNLLNTYGDLLISIIEEIKREQDSSITGTSADEIALEYQKRQGIKQGLTLLIQRINTKANEK